MSNELSARPLERTVRRLYENATTLYDEHPNIADDLRDAAQVMGAAMKAIDWIVSVVDNMGEMRQELCEESIKAFDRGLMDMRNKVSAAQTLEEKLALIKDQRTMERIRTERKRRLFELMDDGAIYAHDPLARGELLALVAPLRELVTANAPANAPASAGD